MSIERETWNTLDSQDKAAWDILSTAAKAKILNGTLKRGEECALTRKPVSLTYSKPTAKTPTVNTGLANVNETHNGQEEEVHKAPPEDPSPNLGSFSHDILDSKLLINFAKSKLPPDICSILSQPTAKAKAMQASCLQGQYDVGFHHVSDSEHTVQHNVPVFLQIFLGCLLFLSTLWSPKIRSAPPILHPTSKPAPYHISVSAHKSSHTGRALIDQGANGGIAGNDVRIIYTTGRTVNVTGIDNHQLCSIKIGTVGAYANTQRRPSILIMHQYAIHQAHQTIHSCVQLEHFKNTVDGKSIKASGGQRLTAPDSYVIPIDIIGGLPYIKMRSYTNTKYATLLHVILTSDVPWNVVVFNCTLSDKVEWYKNKSDWSHHLANGIFDLKGNYNDDYNVQIHDLLCLNDVNATIYNDDYDQELSVAAAESANLVNGAQAVGSCTNIGPVKTRHKINYEALRPFFLDVKTEVVCQTITNTTQFAHNILAGPNMMKTYKSPFPACNVCCCNEAVATNTIVSQVPALDTGGIKVAQIFVGHDTLVRDVYGLRSESQFVNSLLENIRQRGAMDKLISDRAAVEISAKVLDVLHYLQIDSWQSEPYMQHQNFAENRWRDLKHMSDWV
jgi:hypothetical protein